VLLAYFLSLVAVPDNTQRIDMQGASMFANPLQQRVDQLLMRIDREITDMLAWNTQPHIPERRAKPPALWQRVANKVTSILSR